MLCLAPEQLARGVATIPRATTRRRWRWRPAIQGAGLYRHARNAPASKVTAVRAYGSDITFAESTQAARESTLADVCARTGASFIPPYDHPDVIAGQGTTALELAQQLAPRPTSCSPRLAAAGCLAVAPLPARRCCRIPA